MSPLRTAPATPPRQDGWRRAAQLHEVLRTLYPQGGGDRAYLVLPHARRPRLLVPTGAPGTRRVAAAAVRQGTTPRSWWDRLVRTAAAAAVRTGVAELLPTGRVRVAPTGSVEQHLVDMLDQQLLLALHIGPARANQKPVALLLDPTGQPVGFLKVGTGTLTRQLVRTETAALTALSHLRPRELTVPRVRHAGPWRDHQLLVQSALPVGRKPGPAPDPARLVPAMREVAYSCGVSHGALGTSRYGKQLVERAAAVGTQAEGALLARAVATLVSRAGDVTLGYGSWHGDWSPWNLAVQADTMLVWDWERFTVGVPLGFDALHYDLQRRLGSSPDAAAAVSATLATADRLLAPFDVPAGARRPTALLYLADLAARYLTDRQAEAGARLGVLGSWLLPVLTSHLADLT